MTSKVAVPTCLYLIRHGETEWSLSGRHTGRTELPLTARGEDDARELAPRLREMVFARVLTSPRERARRTCELAGLGATMQIDPDLAEWDYGDYEGLHSAEIGELRPDWNIFRDGCPNGESPAQVGGRADRLIARLRAQGGNIGLFSHGQFGCVLAARWIGLPVPQACHFTLGTASLSVLGYDPRHAEVPVIASWNAAPWELFDLQGSPREHLANAMRRRAIERWESEGGKIFPAPQARR